MPEFILDGKTTPAFLSLPPLARGYIEAAFFTKDDEISDDKGFADLPPEEVEKIVAECTAFRAANAEDIDILLADGGPDGTYDEIAAGRDLWYTRNGHGVGFWDRGFTGDAEVSADILTSACEKIGASDLYVGDDDSLYMSP